MGRKAGLVGEIARRSGVSRWTLYRMLRGQTRPQAATVEKLRRAGVELPLLDRVEYPRNVHDFGRRRRMSIDVLDKLMGLGLKPIDLMTEKEIEHILDAMSRYPKLYSWHPTPPPEDQS